MHDTIRFIAPLYVSLAVFCGAFWGLGSALIVSVTRRRLADPWLHHALSLTLGMGLATLAFQWLAIAGGLRRGNINLVLILGWVLAVIQAYQAYRARSAVLDAHQSWDRRLYTAIPLLLAAPTLILALWPPYYWDELMYQLPHARQWAQTGQLTVNEWLRYPWAPQNGLLLYAAGMIVRGEVFPHLLHSLAGWLTALLLFRCALPRYGSLAACLACGCWLLESRSQHSSALMDMTISLYVFGSCVAFLQWLEQRNVRGWLLFSGFLLGCAIASKYQALGFAPFFLVAVALSGRGLANPLQWLAAVAVPSVYWYARNAWMTGNPFNPLAGNLFGYFDWNAQDMAYQLQDLKQAADWPSWMLLPAAFVVLMPGAWRTASSRFLLAFSIYSFVQWWLTSHLARYLLPVYPVLAMLSAHALVTVAGILTGPEPGLRARLLHGLTVVVLVAMLVPATVDDVKNAWRNVAATPAKREQFLNVHAVSYHLAHALRGKDLGKVYQWGLEGVIYYLPNPAYGDHFGPWRYRDLNGLSAADLAARLSGQGFTTLLVHRIGVPGLEAKPEFGKYFTEIAMASGDKAYAIRPAAPQPRP